MYIEGYGDYVDLGVYDSYGWVLDFKNQGVSNRTVSDMLKHRDGPMGQYNSGITYIVVSRNCVVYGNWRNRRYESLGHGYHVEEYYIVAYFYGIIKKKLVSNIVLQVVGTKEKLKNNKLILKVNYVTCKGLKNVIFEFDVSEVKLKLK